MVRSDGDSDLEWEKQIYEMASGHGRGMWGSKLAPKTDK